MEDRVRQEKIWEQRAFVVVEEQKLAEAMEKQKLAEAMEIQKITDAMERQKMAGAMEGHRLASTEKGLDGEGGRKPFQDGEGPGPARDKDVHEPDDGREEEDRDAMEDEVQARLEVKRIRSMEAMGTWIMGARMAPAPQGGSLPAAGAGLSRGQVAYRQAADAKEEPDRENNGKTYYRRA